MFTVTEVATLGANVDSAIRDLAAASDILVADLSSYEFLHEYVLDTPLPAATFATNFTQMRAKTWFAVFGEALSISFNLSAGNASFDGSLTDTDLSALDRCELWSEEYAVERAQVRVCISKEPLISRLREMLNTDIAALFLYESALTKRLALGRLQDLVSDGLLKENTHTVAIVATSSGKLQSPLITIAGLVDASVSDFATLPNPSITVRAWQRALSLRQSTCTWSAPLASTPPDAFSIAELRPGLTTVQVAMTYACGVLSVLQFAVSVRSQGSPVWEAVMAAPGNAHLQVALAPSEGEVCVSNGPNLLAAYRLYRWVFRTESYDKIDIVRDLIQQAIRANRLHKIEELLPLTPDLIDTGRANFKVLRRQAFEAYMKSLNEARATIQQFVESTQQQLDKLRHEALDTTLKFSAAIIAFLAADVLKPGLSTALIVIGFGFGLVYLGLAFVLQLLPLRAQYQNARARAVKVVSKLPELSQKERNQILEDLPHEKGWTPFAKWFAVSCGIYLGWTVMLIIILTSVLLAGHSVR